MPPETTEKQSLPEAGTNAPDRGIVSAIQDAWSNLNVCEPKNYTDVAVGAATAGIAFLYCGGKAIVDMDIKNPPTPQSERVKSGGSG